MPWIAFVKNRGGGRLSDIEFLAIKQFDGKLRNSLDTDPTTDEGPLSATGTLAAITAKTGEDMYLASAKVIFYLNTIPGIDVTSTVELQAEFSTGVYTVLETAIPSLSNHILTSSSITGGTSVFEYEFKNIGYMVAAGLDLRLQCTVIDADTDIEGYITGWGETTGASPQVSSI